MRKGEKMSDELKAKLSLIHTGKKLSEEHKKNIGLAHTGRSPSRKTIEAAIKANTGRVWAEENKRKMSEIKRLYFKKHPEMIQKLRDIATEQMRSMTTKQRKLLGSKISKAMKGVPKSKEHFIKYVESRRRKGNYIPSVETREKMSKSWNYNKHFTAKTRRNMRLGLIRNIEQRKLNGEPVRPFLGKYESFIINNLEKNIAPYKFIRQFRSAGYYVDGYCPALNLAVEVDENHHFRNGKLSTKDTIRQSEIENDLKCSFLRIKAERSWRSQNYATTCK